MILLLTSNPGEGMLNPSRNHAGWVCHAMRITAITRFKHCIAQEMGTSKTTVRRDIFDGLNTLRTDSRLSIIIGRDVEAGEWHGNLAHEILAQKQ